MSTFLNIKFLLGGLTFKIKVGENIDVSYSVQLSFVPKLFLGFLAGTTEYVVILLLKTSLIWFGSL